METDGSTTPDAAPEVRPLSRDDVDAATAVLVDALADDPGWTYVVPDADLRRRALATLVRTAVTDGLRHGHVLVAGDGSGPVGVAVWMPPGRYPMSTGRKVRALPRMLPLALRHPAALRALGRYGDSIDAAVPDEPLWYLQVLGVAPRAQRRGIGRSLVAPGIARADAAGVAAYLDTAKPENRAYYERLGFVVLSDGRPLADGGPPVWTMRRPPR